MAVKRGGWRCGGGDETNPTSSVEMARSAERTQGIHGVTPDLRERAHGQRGGTDGTNQRKRLIATAQSGGVNWQNKATTVGKEGTASAGGMLPGPGGDVRGRPIWETFGPSAGRGRGTWAQRPCRTGWPARGGSLGAGMTEVGRVRQDARHRSGCGRSRGVGVPRL
jgi:hypothetical protein